MGEPYNEAAKRKRGGIDHTMTQYTEPPVHPKEQRNGSPQKQAQVDQDADSEYGPDHASRDMIAMKLDIDAVNRHSNVTTTAQELDPSPTCFVQANTSVPITQMHLSIGIVSIIRIDRATRTKVPTRVQKVLLASTEHPGYSYDLDIAVLTRWHLVHRACPLSPLCRQNPEPDQDVMVIRKSFVARKVPNGLGAMTIVYPDAIQVDGRPWHIRYSTGEPHLCFAFPKPMPFRLDKRTFPVRTIPSDPAPATLSTVLMIVEGPPQNPLTSDAADREFCAKWGLEVPAGFQFPQVGCPLWSPPYGEVYRACKLRAATPPGTSIPVHDVTLGEEVAIKVVRHQNDNVPGAELGWWYENGQPYGSKLIHHEVPDGAALTTEHLSPFFREQSSRGRNENLVNEIETMAFVASAVKEAVNGDSLKLSGASAESNLSYLRSRFLPHQQVALSPDNLFIVTPYAPFGSLTSYISRERARNPKLSEICVKHVLRHMLQGLCFLHERGLAHQDISLENAVLQAPDSAAELRRRSREFLSEADFLRLEVVLIDMGHMGIHQRETDLSLQHSLLNASNITINTTTTCESTTSDPAGPSASVGISLDCSAVHSRAGSMDSSSGMEVSAAAAETPTPQPNRKFRMRPMPKYPLGKRQYQPPELCEVRNPLPYAPGREYCGMCLDIWQLGVLAIYMLTGRPPYEQFDSPISEGGIMLRKEMTWFMAIEKGQLRNRPVTYRDANDQVTVQPLHTKISAPGMALLEKLLQFNPEDRISAKAALEDPWFST